jgi:hypothetical protein
MLKIFDTLGTSRTACILLDNGKVSCTFKLGTGRPQGEIISPDQFNMLPNPGQTFRPDQPKNSDAGEKFSPLQNLLTNANITVLNTLFLLVKGTKNQRYQGMKCTFLHVY